MIAALCGMLGGCGLSNGKELTLWVITDLHYLTPDLYDVNSYAFGQLLSTNDGKMIEYMPELLDEFVEMAEEEKPDAVLITGDLTMNGELESLKSLKTVFSSLNNSGIPVLAIPGNHDINYIYAANLTGDKPIGVPGISQELFQKHMSAFGYDNSSSQAPDSFSYVVELADDLWVMAIDANTEQAPGAITPSTLVWMEAQLQRSLEEHASVIVMSHQNVLPQNAVMSAGYVIHNHEAVQHLLEQYGVSLALSGHSHLQHVSQSDTLTDICTESAAVYPLGFGVIQISEDHTSWTYEKRQFASYQDEAYERIETLLREQILRGLHEVELPDDIQETIVSFGADLAIKHYTGQTEDIDSYREKEGWRLWKEYAGQSFWYAYLQEIMREFSEVE